MVRMNKKTSSYIIQQKYVSVLLANNLDKEYPVVMLGIYVFMDVFSKPIS